MSVNACGVGFSENWLKGRFSNDSKKLTKQAGYLTQFGNGLQGNSVVDLNTKAGALLWFGENGLIHSKLLTSNQKYALKSLCDCLGIRG